MLDFRPGSKLSGLFHKAWGQAQAGPEYDKEVWKQLDALLTLHGCGTPSRPPGTVTFKFPTDSCAGCFVAYMSDGGGEQPFLERMDDIIDQGDLTEADRISQFDYSDDYAVVAS